MSATEELMRAAVEQGAHDGGRARNKTDAKTRNPTRPEKSAWENIVYRAAAKKQTVRVGVRNTLMGVSKADQKAIMDAYLLARG